MMKSYFCLIFLIVGFLSCKKGDSVETGDYYSLLEDIPLRDNMFEERVLKNDFYKIKERTKIPEYIGNIYQLKTNGNGIYISDTESIYRYNKGVFDVVFTPPKGQGPGEVPNIFRFDIRDDDVIAIAGYPEARLLLHQVSTDTSMLIMTSYSEDILIDESYNFYAIDNNNISGNMFCKFNVEGDSIRSMGRLFRNQEKSLNMFDLYWDYNDKYDLIVIGFMYVGYYVVMDTNGNIIYAVESFHRPGQMPTLVNTAGMRYVDSEGKGVMIGLTTNNDEIHIYTAKAMNKKSEVYGAVIDVLDVQTGAYKFSYILKEPLHWPILLLDDYSMVSVTDEYDLVIWKRKQD